MFRFLERLRSEPLERRRSIAVLVTFVALAGVVFLWIVFSVVRASLATPDGGDERRVVEGLVAPF